MVNPPTPENELPENGRELESQSILSDDPSPRQSIQNSNSGASIDTEDKVEPQVDVDDSWM